VFAKVHHYEGARFLSVTGVVPSSFAPDHADAVPLIEALWVTLRGHLSESGVDGPFVGITGPADDVVPPLRITYAASIVVADDLPTPAGLEEGRITPGNYAVFTYEGPHDGLDEFYRVTYNEELPTRDLRTREGQHLEWYPVSERAATVRTEAWIPVD
jgi:predicted transcriptional regulator YdeE